MGYRHYIGYIEKSKLPEIMKEVERLKGLIGKPISDDPEEDEVYNEWNITNYLQDQAEGVYELGKLYYGNTQTIYDVLYDDAHVTDNYSNDDTEFFFINDDKIWYKLSCAYMECWVKWLSSFKEPLNKVRVDRKGSKLTSDDKNSLEELVDTIEETERYYKAGCRFNEAPYNPWQFNNVAVKLYNKHTTFDYSDKVMCVFAY